MSGLYSDDDIKRYAEQHSNEYNVIKLEADNDQVSFGNVLKLSEDIIEILEFMNKPQVKELEKRDFGLYESVIRTKFNKFTYPGVLNVLIQKECDIKYLIKLLKAIDNIKSGKTKLEDELPLIRKALNKEFIDPIIKKK